MQRSKYNILGLKPIYYFITIVMLSACLPSCQKKLIPSSIPKADMATKKPTVTHVEIVRWRSIGNSELEKKEFDTIQIAYKDKHMKYQVVKYMDDDQFATDSIHYDYSKCDTMPDWTVYKKTDSTYVFSSQGIYHFDSLNRPTIEEFFWKDDERFNERKVHHYKGGTNLGYDEYKYNGVKKNKTRFSFDTIHNYEIRTSKSKNATFIDTSFYEDERLIKKAKWTDWEQRKYYNKLPKCYICVIHYKYDDSGKLIEQSIESREGKGKASRLLSYNDRGDLILDKTNIGRKKILKSYMYEYNAFGHKALYVAIKNGTMTEFKKYKITYQE